MALAEATVRAAARGLAADVAAARVLGALAREGIACLLLRGPAVARRLYDEEEVRDYGDVDLLVPPGELERAAGILRSLGFAPLAGRTLRLRDGELEWREVEGEIVALDLRVSTYLSVNRTGTALWPHLTTGASKDELVAALTSGFDVDREAAARDVDAFLLALEEKGLLAR